MSEVQTIDLVRAAFKARYSVPAFNIFDDFSLRGVIRAAEEEQAPLIIQTSVKTVRVLGAAFLRAIFVDRAASAEIPVSLHLDHCPDRAVITEALENGWSSVLFDASDRPFSRALEETQEVVEEAARFGAAVESEIERIRGVEDDIGSEDEGPRYPLDRVAEFVQATGIDIFAPSIGTAHGQYGREPKLDPQRVTALVEATGIPQVLHGGTGLSAENFADLAARGCAKTNVSTAVKRSYLKAGLSHLEEARNRDRCDPPSYFADVEEAVVDMAREHIRMLGASGEAR